MVWLLHLAGGENKNQAWDVMKARAAVRNWTNFVVLQEFSAHLGPHTT